MPAEIEIKRSDWVAHPDRFIDVCVYPFDIRKYDSDDSLEINTLIVGDDAGRSIVLTEELKTYWGFSLGDQVFIPSLFVGRVGDRRNIPVTRIATIAAMDVEPVAYASPRRPAYLVETKSLGGTSGAPVFFHTRPSARMVGGHDHFEQDESTGHIKTPYLLLGVMIGAHSGQYDGDFVPKEENPVSLKDVEFNAGISVVLPISQVLEVINCDRLKLEREASIRVRRDISGYRPTDAV